MTPNRTNIRFKLLTLCLITALLWGATCGYEAFLGPGISKVAAAESPSQQTVAASDALLNAPVQDNAVSVMSLKTQTITLKYRYDFGYQYRLFGAGADNAAAVKTHLNGYQSKIEKILENQFGLSITLDTSARFYSRQDSCYAPNSNPSAVEMMAALTATKIGDDTSSHNACPNSHCTDTTCLGAVTYADNTHHRRISSALNYYISKKVSTAPAIWILYSGYDTCDVNSAKTHSFNSIAGGSFPDQWVGMVTHSDLNDSQSNGRLYRDTLTALHEISHCLGALGGNVDKSHYNNRCIMSSGATRDNEKLSEYWNSAQYSKLYCSDCKTLIQNYIASN